MAKTDSSIVNQTPAQTNSRSQIDKKKYVRIIIGVIIVILLIFLLAFKLNKDSTKNNASSKPDKRNVLITKNNVEKMIDDMGNTPVGPGSYITRMATEWHFKTGNGISDNAYVINDKGNSNNVYFDLFEKGDEKHPILKSPVIARGSKMDHIALDKPLKKGTHDCIIVYHLVNKNQKTLSTVRVGITLTVDK